MAFGIASCSAPSSTLESVPEVQVDSRQEADSPTSEDNDAVLEADEAEGEDTQVDFELTDYTQEQLDRASELLAPYEVAEAQFFVTAGSKDDLDVVLNRLTLTSGEVLYFESKRGLFEPDKFSMAVTPETRTFGKPQFRFDDFPDSSAAYKNARANFEAHAHVFE